MADDASLRALTDRAELGELVAAYARSCDRRDYELVRRVFTDDGLLVIHRPGTDEVWECRTSEKIAKAFTALDQYGPTTHFIGQQTLELAGDTATGETYCMAYHTSKTEPPSNYVMSIRYQDRYVRVDGRWRIAERHLYNDWVDTSPMTP